MNDVNKLKRLIELSDKKTDSQKELYNSILASIKFKRTKKFDSYVVINTVREYFNLRSDFITSKNTEGYIPLAKKIIVDILMNFSDLSYKDIQELLCYSAPSSIPTARKRLNELISVDKKISGQYTDILKLLSIR